jgi:hypothetical protein
MEAISKDKLQEQAVHLMEKHEVSEIHATTDGQFFLHKHFAANHAGNKLTVYTFTKAQDDDEEKPEPLSVSKLADMIIGVEDVALLNDLLTAEQEGLNRSTAIKAIQARIQKLQA